LSQQDEEKYFEAYFDTFLLDGWKQFIGEINELIDNYDISDVKDDIDLYIKQGELRVLRRVSAFEIGIRNAYDHFLEAEQNDDPSV
jgi:N-methylhydantoinase B/oxoprolinase/acetone carboxylase alpha subunit